MCRNNMKGWRRVTLSGFRSSHSTSMIGVGEGYTYRMMNCTVTHSAIGQRGLASEDEDRDS